MKNRKLLVGISLSFVVLILSGLWWTSASQAQKDSQFQAKGTVEGTEVDVNSKIPGRVLEVLVHEGDQVEAGQIIARLTTDELKAKELQAKALVNAAQDQVEQAIQAAKLQEDISKSNISKANGALAAANAQLTKAKKGARDQELLQAQANYDLWQKTYTRVEKLFKQGAVPAQKLDEVQTQLEVAKQTLSMAKEGARKEDIETAQALVEQANAGLSAANASQLQNKIAQEQVQAAQAKYQQALGGLQEVQSYLKDTELKAPISGTITSLTVDAGELVSSGMPIATVTDTKNLWVEIKVKESDLTKIKLKQQTSIVLATDPGKPLSGTVVRIAKKPDFAAKRATNDRGEQDILAYGIKININNPNNLPAVGVTATATFQRSIGE